MTLDQRAQALYAAGGPHYVPPWSRISAAAKQVWRERVLQADGVPQGCWELFLPDETWRDLKVNP